MGVSERPNKFRIEHRAPKKASEETSSCAMILRAWTSILRDEGSSILLERTLIRCGDVITYPAVSLVTTSARAYPVYTRVFLAIDAEELHPLMMTSTP